MLAENGNEDDIEFGPLGFMNGDGIGQIQLCDLLTTVLNSPQFRKKLNAKG